MKDKQYTLTGTHIIPVTLTVRRPVAYFVNFASYASINQVTKPKALFI